MGNRIKEMAIRQLNDRLKDVLSGNKQAIPEKGWIHAIRDVLGMTLKQLASRVGVNHSTVAEYEHREEKGTITLNTLKKVADAMNCDFIYGFVPRDGGFDELRERQARIAAEKMIETTSRSMELEDQAVTDEEKQNQIQDMKNELLSDWDHSIWDFERNE